MGQLLYFLSEKMMRPAFFFLGTCAAFAVLQFGLREIHVVFLPVDNSYLISFAYAYAIFVITLLINPVAHWTLRFFSEISYSLYLVHGTVGLAILDIWLRHPGRSYSAAIVLAMGGVLACAYLFNRFIEKPGQALGRRLPLPGYKKPAIVVEAVEALPLV
jgi:peptidoglycan/LPS O-acetylase OafA/YrhL